MGLTEAEWKQNNDRLAWVLQNRQAIEEAADVSLPRTPAGVDTWLGANKHVVTKALSNASSSAESDAGEDEDIVPDDEEDADSTDAGAAVADGGESR